MEDENRNPDVEHHATGAVRDKRDDKGRYDLISPFALKRLALVFERGAAHYGDRNWEKGMPLCRFFDSAMRHMQQWMAGKGDEDHMGQAMWNLQCILHGEEMIARGVWPKAYGEKPNFDVLQPGATDYAQPPPQQSGGHTFYVAGPYTNGDLEANVNRARRVTQILWTMGHRAHCPHSAAEGLEQLRDVDYESIIEYDLDLIRSGVFTAMFRINGDSPGADREVEAAVEMGMWVTSDLNEVPDLNRLRPETSE